MYRATEGSTESVPLVFGVETVLWPTAAKKGGKWYREVVQSLECFMTRWQKDEAESSWLQHETEDAKSDDQGRAGGKRGAVVVILLSMTTELKWLIVWQGTGSINKWNLSCYSPRVQAVLFGFSLTCSRGGGRDSGSSDT